MAAGKFTQLITKQAIKLVLNVEPPYYTTDSLSLHFPQSTMDRYTRSHSLNITYASVRSHRTLSHHGSLRLIELHYLRHIKVYGIM